MSPQTIYALSSGQLPSGVAIIRVSGPGVFLVVEKMLGNVLQPRQASLRTLRHPHSGEVLDDVLALLFEAPASFTGEDVLELHCHGGVATVSAVLEGLSTFEDLKMADAGEFSRRAFENGKLDLTEIEGLADLIVAQTEQQRRQANQQAGGRLKDLYEKWRQELIRIRSHMEAELDFSDQDDVQDDDLEHHKKRIKALLNDIAAHLEDSNKGQIIRDGLRVVLAGPPNAGKSSLLNALAKRDIAIVTPHAGTTRDIIEVSLDIEGYLVIISDTAGIRPTDDEIEQIGIEKSHSAMDEADLVFWLQAANEPISGAPANAKRVLTKIDLAQTTISGPDIRISTVLSNGTDPVIKAISQACKALKSNNDDAFITRNRYRDELKLTKNSLESAISTDLEQELICEHLRSASDAIGRITGKIDVEDLLDVIFSEFCIGK